MMTGVIVAGFVIDKYRRTIFLLCCSIKIKTKTKTKNKPKRDERNDAKNEDKISFKEK